VKLLLVELSAEELRRVGALLEDCPVLELAAGTTLDAAELPPAVLFTVDSGRAAVVRSAPGSSRRILLALAAPGDVLLAPEPGDHLSALADARLTAIGHDAYRAILSEPEAAVAIAGSLLDALRERERSLGTFGRFPHVERLRSKLLQLARSHGKVSERGVLIDLPLTHDFLAEMVGSARETVTWALRELLQEGFVSRDGRRYRVHVAPEELAGR
jgi:CRP/FNR family cyclic AMP-dependent transcriptional regulator